MRGSSSINLETISLIHKANTPQNPGRSLFFHVCHAPTFSSIPPPKGKLARGKSLSEVQLNGSCLAQADGSLRLECQCLALIPPTITRARLAFIRGLRIRGQSRIGSAGERLHVATGNSNANRFPFVNLSWLYFRKKRCVGAPSQNNPFPKSSVPWMPDIQSASAIPRSARRNPISS